MKPEDITKALQWRYATYNFDSTKKVSDTDLQTILESARLAASSFGLEPWKFLVIKNLEVRAQLQTAGYNQPRFTAASDLIVIAARTDAENLSAELVARAALAQGKTPDDLAQMKTMIDGAMAMKSPEVLQNWTKMQTYIALGTMMETASLLNIDNAAMEGFDGAKVDEILGLSAKNLTVVTILAVGYRSADEAPRPKTRRAYDEVVEVIS